MEPTARGFALLGVLLISLVSLFSAACYQSDFEESGNGDGDSSSQPAVGGEEWGERELTCEGGSDCSDGENCVDGVCQVSPCQKESYDTNAPLGESMPFFENREILAADSAADQGAYFIDAYLAEGSGAWASSGGAWNTGSSGVVDIAGGNFTGDDREQVAAALEGSTEIHVYANGGTERLNVGFEPVAIAAGDATGDGVDDVIVLGTDGTYGLCMPGEGQCINAGLDGDVRSIDVAASDTDGDGYAEAVFLVERDGNIELVTWNPHHEHTGESEFRTMSPSMGPSEGDLRRVAAGDLTGDGIAEVAGIHNRYYPANDRVKIYAFDGSGLARVGNENLETRSSIDVAIGDLDMSGTGELVALREGNRASVFRGTEGDPSTIRYAYAASLSDTSSAARIATADVEGDSPRATRVSGPELVPGPVVPLIAVNFPPYDAQYSSGLPSLMVGDTETTSETFTDSVSLSAGVQIGAEADLFGVLGGGAQASIDRQIQRAESQTSSFTVGNRLFSSPEVENFGSEYGMVIISAGCFHRYTYEVSDPDGQLSADADGDTMVGVVPVDGQATIWTTHRYNALADKLDYLPAIEFATEIGNVESYPSEPKRPDGTPIPPEDMVFDERPSYLVGNGGQVGWWLSYQETSAESTSLNTSVGVMTSLSAGASVSTDVTAGIGSAYDVSVGEQYLFGGNVPSLSGDPDSPTDEYEERAFSFAPYVYRKTYEDPDGEQAGLYVLDFTASQ